MLAKSTFLFVVTLCLKKKFAGLPSSCCKLKCVSQITDSECQTIFKRFYEMGSHDIQSQFIAGCIQQSAVATHSVSVVRSSSSQQREFTRVYTLQLADRVVTVCKTMFLRVLGISAGRVDRILKRQRVHGGVVPNDKRGKYVHKNTLPTAARSAVEQHIASFPVNESHYTRSHSSSVKYLSSDLNLNKMYDLYVEKCKATQTPPVKKWCYWDIFNTKFNLSFYPPRQDTCKRCDTTKVRIEAATAEGDAAKLAELQQDHEIHLRKAEAARTALNVEEQNASGHEAFTFDLQKVLSLPRLTTNEVYYCRQLSVYNIGILLAVMSS